MAATKAPVAKHEKLHHLAKGQKRHNAGSMVAMCPAGVIPCMYMFQNGVESTSLSIQSPPSSPQAFNLGFPPLSLSSSPSAVALTLPQRPVKQACVTCSMGTTRHCSIVQSNGRNSGTLTVVCMSCRVSHGALRIIRILYVLPDTEICICTYLRRGLFSTLLWGRYQHIRVTK